MTEIIRKIVKIVLGRKTTAIIPLWIAAALLAVWPAVSLGQGLTELEADHALTSEVATPHIRWAKPYAQGKIRVLLFIGGRGTVFREGVELMQRFDIEAEALLYGRIANTEKDDWHGGREGLQRMETLLDKEWDIYLFLGVAPAKLPEALREKLIREVQTGSGAVLTGVDEPLLTPAVDTNAAVPFLVGITGAKTFLPVKGRAVQLPARPAIDYAEGWQNVYESWQETLGRALLWAAGREPRSSLTIALSKPAFPRRQPAGLTVQWDGNLAIEKPRLQLWIRGPMGWSAPWPDRELAAGEPLTLTLPWLAAGRYHLDGRVVGTAGVEAWTTVPFEVMSPRRIDGIELTPDWGEIGGKIAGSLILSGFSEPNERVQIDVLDKDRRVLLRRDVMAGSNLIHFSFDIPPWLPMLATVEASVMDGNKVAANGYRYFHVTHRKRDRFNFLMWDVPRGTLAPYAEEVLARTGVTLQLARATPPLYVAACDIAWVPYTTDITAKLDAKGVMMPFCWNDRAAVDANTRKLAEQYRASRQHGVFAYSLGDEISTQGACLAATCIEAYRGYLKEVYGSLAALNRSWGTDFATWEAVGLSEQGDHEERHAFESRNYPRWFDRRAFKSWNFVQYARKYAGAFAEIDPQAKTGFEGAGYFAGGDDVDLIVRNLGYWASTYYPDTTDEIIRSIALREFLRANWMGYTRDADSLLQKYWRMVTRGMDSVWWWRWECIGRFHGWLAPDLRPYPAVKELLEDTMPVREGLGDLLLKSRMRDDGIAIFYSYPSTFAHRLDEGAAFGEYEKTHVAWHKAIRDLGLQFSYVTDRMLRLGEFDMKRSRVLVLPRAEAIGDKEAKVIRSFVEKGGTVIADTRPGIYDDHCRKRAAGILDALFGIRRSGFPTAKMASTSDNKMSVAFDPGVVATNGRATLEMVGTPALILHKVGKGHALLLNGDINLLNLKATGILERFGPSEAFADAPLGSILRGLAGIEPKIALKREGGSAMRDAEIIRWENGRNTIFALFRQGGKGEPATVKLPRAGHVYDLRNRKSLGLVKEFRTEIIPNRAIFFAVTPKAVPPVKVQIENTGAGSPYSKRGTVVKAHLSVPGAQGTHAFAVTASFPSVKAGAAVPRSGNFFPRTGYPSSNAADYQEKPELLKRVVLVGNKPVTVDLPIAFNDPTGHYEIAVTDLFTQKTATGKWTVQ